MTVSRPSSDAIFLGYRAKSRVNGPDWTSDPRMKVLASISDCISNPPEDWPHPWTHNRGACYDSIDAALATIPAEDEGDFLIFAYRWIPEIIGTDGEVRPLRRDDAFDPAQPELPSSPNVDQDLAFLGFDVATVSVVSDSVAIDLRMLPLWGCSPLSCNGRVSDFNVNEWCLFHTLEEARAAARDFAAGGGEPPPYSIFEVWTPVPTPDPRKAG